MPEILAKLKRNPPLRLVLRDNMEDFRAVVAREIGYAFEEIGFAGVEIDDELQSNCKPLAFFIDAGSLIKSEAQAETMAAMIKAKFIERCAPLARIEFSVWLRGFPINGFAEHKVLPEE